MDTRRILEQFTGNRGGMAPNNGLEGLLGGLLGGGRGNAAPNTGMGSLGGMLDALGGGTGRAGGLPGGGTMTGGPGTGAGGGGLGGVLDALGGRGGTGGGMGGGLGGVLNSPMGRTLGTAAAGGLLGSILSGGRGGGGRGNSPLIRMGGLAILGALAHRAWKEWQANQPQAAPATAAPDPEPHPEAPAADDQPFGLAVIRAMVAAAKADGALDGAERERIFQEAEKLELEEDERGFVFNALQEEADPRTIARLARTEAQKAQLYLASLLVGPADTAAERAWLRSLAHELGLPPGLKESLDAQARQAEAAIAQAG